MLTLLYSLLKSRGHLRLLSICWVVVAVLAMVGLRAHPVIDGTARSFWDDVYQLPDFYSLGVGLDLAALDWRLQAARWLGPIVAGAAVLELASAILGGRLALWRAGRASAHVVVCGGGGRGRRIAAALKAEDRPVVCVEHLDATDDVRALRASGVPVVIGDARDPDVLEKAGVGRAALVVVTAGADATNAEVAAAVATTVTRTGATGVGCAVHLADAGLASLLRHRALQDAFSGVRWDFFDIYSAGARIAVEELLEPTTGHLVVVGLGQLGTCVVEEAVREVERRSGDHTLRVTVVDRDASGRVESLLLGRPVPEVDRLVTTVDIDTERPTRGSADAFRALLADGSVDAVFVCFDDDARSVETALLVRTLLAGRPARIVARTTGTGGLTRLLDGGALGITPFPLLERACGAAIVTGGTHEQVARGLHADYTDRVEGAPYDVPWDELPAEVQESNRKAADALAANLSAIGCELIPAGGWATAEVAFSVEEVETLGGLEHERWLAERLAAGWRYAAARDNETRTNPLLVPWRELPETAREDGRTAAHRVPAILSRAGLSVVRIGGQHPSSHPTRSSTGRARPWSEGV